MAGGYPNTSVLQLLSLFLLLITTIPSTTASSRKLNALAQENQLVLTYHNGPLLKGNYSIDVIMYGTFTRAQRSILLDFLSSLTLPSGQQRPPQPQSVASWWATTEAYRGGSTNFTLGMIYQIYNLSDSENHVNSSRLMELAKLIKGGPKSINVVLTGADVVVEGFCTSKCGSHVPLAKSVADSLVWVGNSAQQCPGQCAWPFHRPTYGPQTPPLVAPNGYVGIDGMVINLATLLAGTVTNPYGTGYFQGPKDAPLEAVSACTGIFGKGAYPGYPGQVLVDKTTGASYNANGINGRKYLLPAMWDPKTSQCATLV